VHVWIPPCNSPFNQIKAKRERERDRETQSLLMAFVFFSITDFTVTSLSLNLSLSMCVCFTIVNLVVFVVFICYSRCVNKPVWTFQQLNSRKTHTHTHIFGPYIWEPDKLAGSVPDLQWKGKGVCVCFTIVIHVVRAPYNDVYVCVCVCVCVYYSKSWCLLIIMIFMCVCVLL